MDGGVYRMRFDACARCWSAVFRAVTLPSNDTLPFVSCAHSFVRSTDRFAQSSCHS
jgi:hypothetical protein